MADRFVKHVSNSDADIKQIVMSQFPYMAPVRTFRSGDPSDADQEGLIETERGIGTTSAPIFTMGASRWGSRYYVVTD